MTLVPYYQDEVATIYLGDCRDILPALTADVLVTDPPYGMAYHSGWKETSRIANDDSTEHRDAVLGIWGGANRLSCSVDGRWSAR